MRITRKRYTFLLLLSCLVSLVSLWTSFKSVWITQEETGGGLEVRNGREMGNMKREIFDGRLKTTQAYRKKNASEEILQEAQELHEPRAPAVPEVHRENSEADEKLSNNVNAQQHNAVNRDSGNLHNNIHPSKKLMKDWFPKPAKGPRKVTRKAGIDLMRTTYRLARKLPNATVDHKGFFSNVTSILETPWRHDPHNAELFRFIYRNVTRQNAYDDTILTLKNKGKRMKGSMNIPKESLLPRGAPYNSCSIVGSSRILLGSKCGQQIDENHFVLRSTLSSIAGPDDDVGKKTNMTTLNSAVLKRFAIRLPHEESLTLVRANKNHYQQNNVFWRQLGLKRYPSIDFFLLTSALDLCLEVNVFGLWPFSTYLDGRRIPVHFYDTSKLSESHDLHHEMRLIMALHGLGVLKLNVGDCS